MAGQSSGSVIVYGREGCVQCDFTRKQLEKFSVPYEYKHIDDCPDTGGITQLPIVVAGEQRWGGLKVDRIRELSKTSKANVIGGVPYGR